MTLLPGEKAEGKSFRSWGPFYSLTYPGFRLLLGGQICTSAGSWMEQVSRGWLVYELTGSPLLLGMVQATRAAPLLLFGVIAGAIADRYDRKKQLVIAQQTNAFLNLILALLIITGHVQAWHVFATAFLAGLAQAFQQPARQSLIPDLVDRDHLLNAISLNSAVLNLSRTMGPAFAGLVIAAVGTGGSYILQAVMLMFASVWTRQLPVADRPPSKKPEGSLWHSLTDGFRYVRGNPTASALLALALIPIVLAQPYSTLMPVFARDIFEIGATGQGLLLSSAGVGSLLGALANAAWAEDAPWAKGVQLLGGLMIFGAALVVFALSPWTGLAFVALFVIGASSTSYRAVDQTLIQTHTDDEYRGRVMSLYLLDRGFAPLGASLVGLLATWLGARDAVAIMGAATFALATWTAVAQPRVRRLD